MFSTLSPSRQDRGDVPIFRSELFPSVFLRTKISFDCGEEKQPKKDNLTGVDFVGIGVFLSLTRKTTDDVSPGGLRSGCALYLSGISSAFRKGKLFGCR